MGMYSDHSTTIEPRGRTTDHDAPEITLVDLLRVLSQHRRLLVLLPLGLATAFAAWSLSRPRTYTASAAFAAHSGGTAPGLSGIAAQLGIGAMATSGETPAYYAEVCRSSAVLGAIADSSVWLDGEGRGRRVSMPEVLDIRDPDPERRRGLTAEALRKMISVQASRETGIIRVTVTSEDPRTAAQIARHLLAEVNEFNLKQRQAQASKERQFAERQLASARAEASKVQAQLATFLERNRQYQNSPALVVEYERLQRAAMEREQVVSSLIQIFDQARLEEVRNVPRIAILEPALPPLRPDPRGTLAKAGAGIILGLVLAVGIVFSREYLRASALAEALARR